MALCCRSGGCHENGRHEVHSDSIMESIMQSLANSVPKMLLGEHIAAGSPSRTRFCFGQEASSRHSREFRLGVGIFLGTVLMVKELRY